MERKTPAETAILHVFACPGGLPAAPLEGIEAGCQERGDAGGAKEQGPAVGAREEHPAAEEAYALAQAQGC